MFSVNHNEWLAGHPEGYYWRWCW